MGAIVPPDAGRALASWIDRIDGALPGRIEGVYVTGSIALGDYRPGPSDVDVVAITASPLTTAELGRAAAAHRAHERAVARPELSAAYLSWDQIRQPPAAAGDAPFWRRRWRERHNEVNPALWHTLALRALAVRGPAPTQLGVAFDRRDLTAWCLDNLDSYWRAALARGRRLASRAGLAGLSDPWVAWMVLGAPRLHYSIATGDVTSKDGAGRYVLERLAPAWHPIAAEALRIRRDGRGVRGLSGRLARRLAMLDLVAFVIEDAHRIDTTR